jgi:hypothetical protein
VFGGIVSDKFVAKMGIRSRVAVLAISQVSTHFDFLLSGVGNSKLETVACSDLQELKGVCSKCDIYDFTQIIGFDLDLLLIQFL